jgi:AbrB family looped-hinge helix DNA binding protein
MKEMEETYRVQVGQRGVVTLPKKLREHYRIHEGDQLTLIDLGGVFILSSRRTEIDHLADQIQKKLIERGETLEDMLQALQEARQAYGS